MKMKHSNAIGTRLYCRSLKGVAVPGLLASVMFPTCRSMLGSLSFMSKTVTVSGMSGSAGLPSKYFAYPVSCTKMWNMVRLTEDPETCHM